MTMFMMTRTRINKQLVELVKKRAGGYCEICGRVAQESMALHHRKLKSRGGKDEASNLLYLHHECHNLGTHGVHNQVAYATSKGWIVNSWAEPSQVPVVLAGGNVVMLLNDGETATVMEGE